MKHQVFAGLSFGFATLLFFLTADLKAEDATEKIRRVFITGSIGLSLAERIDANESGYVRGKVFFNAPVLAAELRLLGGWTLGLRGGTDLLLKIEGTGELSNAEPISGGLTWGAFSRYYFPLQVGRANAASSLFVGASFQAVSGKFTERLQATQWAFELGQRRIYSSGLLLDYHLACGALVDSPSPDSLFLSFQFSVGLAVF